MVTGDDTTGALRTNRLLFWMGGECEAGENNSW